MNREMGEPFTGTGSPPEGYRSGDYVEYTHGDGRWIHVPTPGWLGTVQYRFEANHSHYLPPVWCLDRAAQLAGRGGWGDGDFGSQRLKKSIIAHARTLRDGCEPMQDPVDPLEVELLEATKSCPRVGNELFAHMAEYLRARFDITEKSK